VEAANVLGTILGSFDKNYMVFKNVEFFGRKKSFQRRKYCEGKYRNFRNILIVEMKNSKLIT
jgi:hypothetical protein